MHSLFLFPFLFQAVLIAAQDTTLHIPLVFLASQGTSSNFSVVADNLRSKYGFQTSHEVVERSVLDSRASADLELIDQERDLSYLGTLTIGTPPQIFNTILDTGSADLWVANGSCQNCDNITPTFSSSQSSTFSTNSKPLGITYGSGEVSGTLCSDVVSMAGFTVSQQPFIAVDSASGGLLTGSNSGIMGLAFSTLTITRSLAFWENLSTTGQLTAKEMSFYFRRYLNVPNPAEEKPGGVFTLGGRNNTFFVGDVEFSTVETPAYWMIDMRALVVNGQSIPLSGQVASAIDTGTTLIGGPSRAVDAFWSTIAGSRRAPNRPGFYTYPCSTSLQVSISFGSKLWPLNPADLNLGRSSSTACLGAIFDLTLGSAITPAAGRPQWVVGGTFLKNVYSVFRAEPPSVGFAQLSAAAGGSDSIIQTTQTPIPTGSAPAGRNWRWTHYSLPFIWAMITIAL